MKHILTLIAVALIAMPLAHAKGNSKGMGYTSQDRQQKAQPEPAASAPRASKPAKPKPIGEMRK